MYEMICDDDIRSYRGDNWNCQPDPVTEEERYEEWIMNMTEEEYESFLQKKRSRA